MLKIYSKFKKSLAILLMSAFLLSALPLSGVFAADDKAYGDVAFKEDPGTTIKQGDLDAETVGETGIAGLTDDCSPDTLRIIKAMPNGAHPSVNTFEFQIYKQNALGNPVGPALSFSGTNPEYIYGGSLTKLSVTGGGATHVKGLPEGKYVVLELEPEKVDGIQVYDWDKTRKKVEICLNGGIKTVSFTNLLKVDNKGIVITKRVIGTQTDLSFTFTIKESDGNPLDLSKLSSADIAFTPSDKGELLENGVTGKLTLKHGGTVTIKGLPMGGRYTVTETSHPGFITKVGGAYTNEASVQAGGAVCSAVFDNIMESGGGLAVKKTVTGYSADDEVFVVTIAGSFSDGTSKKTVYFTSDGLSKAGIAQNSVVAEIGSEYIVSSVKAGETYKITEEGVLNGNRDNYEVTVTDNGIITIGSEVKTITVNNTRKPGGSLEIKKVLENSAESGKIFYVKLKAANGSYAKFIKSNDSYIFDASGTSGSGELIQISEDKSAIIKSLPLGAEFAVEEVLLGVSNGYSVKSIYPSKVTVGTGASFVTVTNTFDLETVSLTVTKAVTGGAWDSADTFKFILYKDGAAYKTEGTDENGMFTLSKASPSITFSGLEPYFTYKVLEVDPRPKYVLSSFTNSDGFTTDINARSAEKKIVSGGQTITFNNERNEEGTITINKTVNGIMDDGDSFVFELSKYTALGYEKVFLTENNHFGGALPNGIIINEAGQLVVFKAAFTGSELNIVIRGIEYDQMYRVEEKLTGTKYALTSPASGSTVNIKADSSSEAAVFVNERRTTSLSIKKEVDGDLKNGDSDEFTVRLMSGGKYLLFDKESAASDGNFATYTFKGLANTNSAEAGVSIKRGEVAELLKLPLGLEVTIVEDERAHYSVTYKLGSGNAQQSMTCVLENSNELVTVINKFKGNIPDPDPKPDPDPDTKPDPKPDPDPDPKPDPKPNPDPEPNPNPTPGPNPNPDLEEEEENLEDQDIPLVPGDGDKDGNEEEDIIDDRPPKGTLPSAGGFAFGMLGVLGAALLAVGLLMRNKNSGK